MPEASPGRLAVPCETELMALVGRTQLFSPADLPNVNRIQAGHKLQPLSQFLKEPAPPFAPLIQWLKPLKSAELAAGAEGAVLRRPAILLAQARGARRDPESSRRS